MISLFFFHRFERFVKLLLLLIKQGFVMYFKPVQIKMFNKLQLCSISNKHLLKYFSL
jgi:hypothetical protein